ncbi:hypothetical protein P3T76_002703 [Phytophthora citrophthora]|uniref:Uncharacterized protein n=1 Tax=Phytophthora citrophthora TaxID=4793 RepID=A0AAD9GVE8_9STRA|nr:hypothetical protein P3T76_002703 [Phytophthora citrophthora]
MELELQGPVTPDFQQWQYRLDSVVNGAFENPNLVPIDGITQDTDTVLHFDAHRLLGLPLDQSLPPSVNSLVKVDVFFPVVQKYIHSGIVSAGAGAIQPGAGSVEQAATGRLRQAKLRLRLLQCRLRLMQWLRLPMLLELGQGNLNMSRPWLLQGMRQLMQWKLHLLHQDLLKMGQSNLELAKR